MLADRSLTMPILTFPCVSLIGVTVPELVSSAELQARGMKAIADRCRTSASVSPMDLSVEAEAFGAKITFTDEGVPTVIKGIIDDIGDASDIRVPDVGEGRTAVFIDGVRRAKALITDRPVFAGVVGPYSLAGRLFDMTELMMECFDSPDEVGILLSKATEFITAYIKAYKDAGADGVVIAEPAAGILSPALADEFSMPYVKKIIEAVADDGFAVCYHNCGNSVPAMAESIAALGADIYHFGNAVRLADLIPKMPADSVVMGNLDPVLLASGETDAVTDVMQTIYNECSGYANFIMSTGCDVPAAAKWENIDAYFAKIAELYQS